METEKGGVDLYIHIKYAKNIRYRSIIFKV